MKSVVYQVRDQVRDQVDIQVMIQVSDQVEEQILRLFRQVSFQVYHKARTEP
jgi:hypothetical protein